MNEEVEQDFTDQYLQTGAMNFPAALTYAAETFMNLNEKAQEEVNLVIVDRAGSVYIIGTGEHFATNEYAPSPAGFIIYRDDIIEFVEDEDADAEEGEGGEPEPTDEIGNDSQETPEAPAIQVPKA